MKSLATLELVAFILVLIGGINWGLIGLFRLNLIGVFFGDVSLIARLIYLLVGVSAGYLIYQKWFNKKV